MLLVETQDVLLHDKLFHPFCLSDVIMRSGAVNILSDVAQTLHIHTQKVTLILMEIMIYSNIFFFFSFLRAVFQV